MEAAAMTATPQADPSATSASPRARRVVLAYSGGVDTSVCIPYLKREWGVEEVITFAADLGQGDELEPIRRKALDSGASHSIVGDLIEPFIREFAFPAIRANALYEGRYPRSTADRPPAGGGGEGGGSRCGGPRLHRQGQ
jgi:argininosuccinate synthase